MKRPDFFLFSLIVLFSFFLNVSFAFSGDFSKTPTGSLQDGCEPKWGTDSVEAVKAVSLYGEFLKQNNIKDALPYWRYVFKNAPGARQTTFIDGSKIYKELIDQTQNPDLKNKYIDTLMLIYEKRMACFGETGELQGRFAIEMLNYQPEKTEDIYKKFSRSVEMDKSNTKNFILYPFAVAIVRAEKGGVITKEKLLEEYGRLTDLIDQNIKKGKDVDTWKSVQKQVDELFAPYLDCESLKPVLQKQYDAAPEDKEVLTKIFNQLRAARCLTDPLFIQVTEKLFATEPDAEKARILAINYSNMGNYGKAENYYKQAINLEKDKETIAEYYMSLAEISYRRDDYVKARDYARQAISTKPNWGKPYLLIGDLYRGSGKKCGPGTGWDSQVVTWPAIDMYEKAKAVDPSVTNEANRKIADTRQYMPSKGEAFMRNLNEGATFKVECWINETTTVRYGPD